MAEADYTASMAEIAVEAAWTIIQTIGEAVEDMNASAEATTEKDTVDVAIMIVATMAI